jgi:hypothetical protein
MSTIFLDLFFADIDQNDIRTDFYDTTPRNPKFKLKTEQTEALARSRYYQRAYLPAARVKLDIQHTA